MVNKIVGLTDAASVNDKGTECLLLSFDRRTVTLRHNARISILQSN